MGKLSATSVVAPTVTSLGTKLSWNTVSGAVNYVVYQLEKDKTLKNTFNAHAVQISSDIQFVGLSGMSYFVTAVNVDHVESARSTVITLK